MIGSDDDAKDAEQSQSEKKKKKSSKTKSSKKTTPSKSKSVATPSPVAPINEMYYTVMIHVCDETLAASSSTFYARLNADYGRTEWIEFGSDGLDKDGLYIFYVDAQKEIGSVVESIDFTAIATDPI